MIFDCASSVAICSSDCGDGRCMRPNTCLCSNGELSPSCNSEGKCRHKSSLLLTRWSESFDDLSGPVLHAVKMNTNVTTWHMLRCRSSVWVFVVSAFFLILIFYTFVFNGTICLKTGNCYLTIQAIHNLKNKSFFQEYYLKSLLNKLLTQQ